MKKEAIQEILDCLPKGRTKFYYFRDRYALLLLSYIVGDGKPLAQIKKSRFNRLACRPLVQKIIKDAGSGEITARALNSVWPETYHCYLLTLGIWGGKESWSRFYNQTSRPGWNLVLQLNFASRHNHAYNRLLRPRDPQPFHCDAHPIAGDGRHTLAWARIDLDLHTGEALIEEIQTDWIRRAMWSKHFLAAQEKSRHTRPRYIPGYVKSLGCDYAALCRYLEETLKPHMRVWDEAMLASAIWFLVEEIGIGKIFYHTYRFGSRIKGISGANPPRSLYTKLPDRFCFQMTHQVPSFLMQGNRRKVIDLIKKDHPRFYLQEFSNALS